MVGTRSESDSMGIVSVPVDRLWGAQTQRSLENFPIGDRSMPLPLIKALALVKKAAALANARLGVLPSDLATAIAAAADEVVFGSLDGEFPLVPWQTGSGTQTNMNMNEVLANRANQILGNPVGSKSPVHPNDHVNRSQSSNDSFPSAMHVAVAMELEDRLLPALDSLAAALRAKCGAFAGIIKIGRTHLQDATPLTLGQEIGAWASQVEVATARLRNGRHDLSQLAQGGTAVGTGLNSPPGFDLVFCMEISRLTGLSFFPAPDKFALIAAHDGLVALAGDLDALAVGLLKVTGDIRLLASGPRCGIGELILPANEPGSSIMPGKINPTQAEALAMVCCQVMGNGMTVRIAGSQGQLQLNAFKPVIALNLLDSIGLLADACASFQHRCIDGLMADHDRIAALVERSLMLVTALSPHIGYDHAAEIAASAMESGASLREAALASGFISEDKYDEWVRPERMLGAGGGSTQNTN